MNDATWKPWPGDERYLVSDRGDVASYASKGHRPGENWRPLAVPHPMKIHFDKNGYPFARLACGRRRIHILVLETFAESRPLGMQGRHLNDIKTDNRWPENLAWGTQSENMQDKVRNGRHHNANKTHCRNNHEYAGDNLVLTASGERICRKCKSDNFRKWYNKQQH